MNYLSVCSGIEAATVAWHHMGWKPVGFSEIEKFPSEVLAHHYPSVTNYGDMTKFKEWNINEPVNLLVGGTPCQSFSIAGLRGGLEDPRGNLMLTYLAMAGLFKPKWLLWENVYGVLSSNRGSDFATLLQGMAECGYGFAYRVLDAQYFGVPQRRRRVFVVGCLGDWRSAAKVLFESESLCRNITPSRQAQQEVANTLTRSPSSHSGFNPAKGEGNGIIVPIHARDSSLVSGTLTASYGTGGVDLNTKPLVHNVNLAIDIRNGKIESNGTTMTLQSGGMGDGRGMCINAIPHTFFDMRVRRLTPKECERLQGFPDDYTNIPNAKDTNRYKALGNSMAVPVMRWIGERINGLV
jgi:DNA (cytosine-5)-methyltransferase 1